jgi:hypothetical protein
MINVGQVSVPGNATTAVLILPPGTMNTCIYQPTAGAPAAVYVGGPNVSATNGMMVPVTPLNVESYVSSGGKILFATTGSSTASSFSFIIATGE